MDLKQVRSFVEVARVKRFTEAAERLHLSQPAVSAQIRALEKDLGAELLERTTKRVRLTEKGRQFYTYAVRIMELERTAREKMVSPGGHVITLGASTIPSSCLLPPVLASYRRERPDCFSPIHRLLSDWCLTAQWISLWWATRRRTRLLPSGSFAGTGSLS